MRAIRLRTEYLENPLGIDFQEPRLMWNAEGSTTQTAYRIVSEHWDSGRVESSSMQAHYPRLNTITDEQLHQLEVHFGVKARDGFLS